MDWELGCAIALILLGLAALVLWYVTLGGKK